MTRAAWALVLVIAAELVGALLWLRSHPPATAGMPRPDLGILDSASAGEITSRQERVQTDGTAEAWTDLASIFITYGYFPEAAACCQRAEILRPAANLNNFWWGITLYRLGRITESNEKFRVALETAESSQIGIIWYCIGLNFLREERAADAEQAFRQAGAMPSAEYELAKLFVRSGRADQALPVLEKLTQNNPQSVRYWQLRANAAAEVGQLEQSEDFRERAERAPEEASSEELTGFLIDNIKKYGPRLLMEKGKQYLESGRTAESVKMLRQGVSLEWQLSAADMLAEAEVALGHSEGAMGVLSESIDRAGTTSARLLMLGDAFRLQGNQAEAVRHWELATRLHLEGPAHARLAAYCDKIGDTAEARRHLAIAKLAEGLTAYRQDQLPQAVGFIETAVKLNPDYAHAWFYLGECRRSLNDPMAARAAYERCLALAPHHGRAKQSLARLTAIANSAGPN